MDRTAAFSIRPLAVRARELVEGYDDQLTVDLPCLHAEITDVSWSISAIEAFRDQLRQLLSGQAATAVLDLAYDNAVSLVDGRALRSERGDGEFTASYGLRAVIAPIDDGRFAVTVSLQPDMVDGLQYWVTFNVDRGELERSLAGMRFEQVPGS